MVNRVILIGNLGKDPEVRRLESGAVVAKFPLATNENYRDKSGEWQSSTEWHDIVVWRQLAERAERDLKKGAAIYVEGKLTHRTWQDQDGNNRRTTEVVGSYFRILNRRDGGSGDDNRGGYFPSSSDEGPMTGKSPEKDHAEDTSVKESVGDSAAADDDLPF